MNKYNKGKIYKITSPNTEDVYYGSTILSLNKRFRTHKKCNSKKIIDAGDAKVELVENYPCESKQELLWRERYYIENFDCVNKMKPIVTKEEEIITKKLCDINYMSIRISCRVCKCEMSKHYYFTRHKKSKKHLEKIKN